MLIEKFTIADYKPFEVPNISKLEVIFNSSTQIIIGDNGSGKSSLLRELTPFASSKPDYNKRGYKELDILHEGNYYKISSNFGNKHNTHSFVVNENELNISGIQSVQNELVEKHLGMNDILKKLTSFEYEFCRMTKSERKNLLLQINPIDLDFILDLHRKTLSKIRENKNNLSLLYQRKLEIENKLLNKELFSSIKKDKIDLSKLHENLNKLLFLMEQDITNKENNLKDYNINNLDLDEISSVSRRINNSLIDYINVPRIDILDNINKVNLDISLYKNKQNELINNIENLKEELDKLEQLQKENNNIKNIHVYEKEIKESDKLIKEYEKNIDSETLSLEEIDILKNNIYQDIVNQAHMLLDYSLNNIYSAKDLQRLQNIENKLRNKYTSTISVIDNTTDQYNNLKEELNKLSILQPFESCNFDCSLKSTYDNRLKNFITKENGYKQLLHRAERKKDIYYKRLTYVVDKKNEQKPFQMFISKLKDYFESYSFLYKIFTNLNIPHMIKNNPMSISILFNKIIENSFNKIELDKLVSRKKELEAQILLFKNSNLPTTEYISNQIIEKSNLLMASIKELNGLSSIISLTEEHLNKLTGLSDKQKIIKDILVKFKEYEEYKLNEQYVTYMSDLKNKYTQYRNDVQSKLIEIESIIKEQESLLTRYDDEIMIMIKAIEKDKIKYEQLEKALSPAKGIPHRYLSKYINNLISNINYFIEQIWSQPFVIKVIDEDLQNDFNFIAVINDREIGDITRCSAGQQSIVNICFILAILLHMQKLDKYPIYLDEPDAALDVMHRQKLLEFLSKLVNQKIISQLFIVNHNMHLTSGFNDSEVICLSNNNIVTPAIYNQHVSIE